MKTKIINRSVYIMLIFLLTFNVVLAQTAADRYTSQSVLATGNWFKIKVDDTGFYKITYEKLKEWGITDPKNVQIYGYGGWVLDQDFTSSYLKTQDDLPKVAVWMSNTRDKFGPGDYILFYGKGSLKWVYNSKKTKFQQLQNPYSTDAYYFITESTDGPLITEEVSTSLTGANTITTYDDYYLHEKELVNITQTGQDFYGEDFRSKKSQDFAVSLPGISTADYATVDLDFIARTSTSDATVSLSLNGSMISTSTFRAYSDYYEKATKVTPSNITNLFAENNTINITYKSTGSSEENVRLNYFRINYKRILKPYGAVTLFRSKTISSLLEFKISDATNKLLVFDVTDGEKPKVVKSDLSGTTLSFKASNENIKEYAMVDISKSIPEPSYVEKVVNQNLHALDKKDMIIIVRPILKKYADELAQIHKETSGLESIVVSADDLYNEFSSGKPDVTAYRRFLKMFYDRGTTENNRPKYLLLFGNGTYDNRFTESTWTEKDKKVFLLTYQSYESKNEAEAFVTDDYIGFLEDSEGIDAAIDNFTNTNILTLLGNYTLDIGIGRLPVRDESEASAMVSKIKTYIADKDKGIWKNNIGLVADDLNAGNDNTLSGEFDHVKNADTYANTINSSYPNFITNKIYLDAYERTITASGGRYQAVEDLLIKKINSGLLLLDYVGHGSTKNWTHENIIDNTRIEKLTNKRLPVIITATCDFGRFDAKERSGGELFVLNPTGGAIALFTTVRVVYSSQNDALNKNFIDNIFRKDDNNDPLRIGDVMRKAKTAQKSDKNKLRFMLLGDPALRLAYPGSSYKIKVTEINDVDVSTQTTTIKALSNNVIKGVVVDLDGNTVTDFQGKIDAIIYDSKQTLKTRGNLKDGTQTTDKTVIRDYLDYTNTLYSGTTDVENGEFSIKFTTTKDILYANDFGKMSFYAYNEDNSAYQAQGSFFDYKVGGMDDNAVEETNSPQISKLYLNRESFVNGGKVNSTPIFYAEVSDDTGINLSNGIGHNLSLIVDGLTSYDLRTSFESTDGQKAGFVKFVMPELTEGRHSLLFRVWDLWNNSEYATLDFDVVPDYKPAIYKFQILGNPAKDKTTFSFISDINGSEVDVKYQVYSLTGALMWSYDIQSTTSNEYTWNLTGSNGSRLQPGVYVCRMSVSVNGGAKASKSEKLIILEQ